LNLSSFHSFVRLLASRFNSSSRSFVDVIEDGPDPSRSIPLGEVTGPTGALSRGTSSTSAAVVVPSKSKPAMPGDGPAWTSRTGAVIEGLMGIEEAAVDVVGMSEGRGVEPGSTPIGIAMMWRREAFRK